VAGREFDRKFGEEWLQNLPASPAVYLFRDEQGEVLYVGKAKDVRRRLSGYRNASRRKRHGKMRALVREASSVEVRQHASERAALLEENALIRELRPRYNVDGAYCFLYPSIGVCERAGQALFCFTTRVDLWDGVDFRWYGSFRSRLRAKDAFDALIDLVTRIGHREPRTRLPELPRARGARVVAVRRFDSRHVSSLHRLLAGESRDALGELALALLEKPSARRDAGAIQEALQRLADFYATDITKLRAALGRLGREAAFVPQDERDALFIESRHL
jgi:excinuclease UvrABC nuclease subunit